MRIEVDSKGEKINYEVVLPSPNLPIVISSSMFLNDLIDIQVEVAKDLPKLTSTEILASRKFNLNIFNSRFNFRKTIGFRSHIISFYLKMVRFEFKRNRRDFTQKLL